MSRALPALLLVPALAFAAPRSKEREAADYFPTREGDRREYEVRAGGWAAGGYTDVVTRRLPAKPGPSPAAASSLPRRCPAAQPRPVA